MKNNIISTDIEKGRPLNPNLVLTHIIDKNGHHTMRYKLRDEVAPAGEQHHHVAPGHKVLLNNHEHTILGIQDDGYLKLKDANGRTHYKVIRSAKFVHPETDEKVSMQGETNFNALQNQFGEIPTAQQQASTRSVPTPRTAPADEENEVGLDYELHGTPAERMSEDWVDLIKGFAKNRSKNLVVAYGTGGVGKTFNVMRNQDIKEGLTSGDIVKFTGGTTAAGFLEMLYNNRDKKIILDDFDMVFADPQMLSLLATLSRSDEKRIVTKGTSGAAGGDIPDAFEFTGKIMVISNIDLEQEALKSQAGGRFEEILTNAGKVNLRMTKKETWDLIDNVILHNPDGGVNHNLKFNDAIGLEVESTDADREDLASFFKENWKKTKELSGRTLAKANAIQSFYREHGADWKEKASKMLLQNDGSVTPVEERYKDFNDAVDMIGEGLMKSAIVVDKNSNRIISRLKAKGFKKSSINGGWELQKQSDPGYVPSNSDEAFATQMYHVVTAPQTEKAFYETLFKHNGKIIIFDKSAKKILSSDLGQGLMKGALDTSGDGDIAWLSKSEGGKYKPEERKKASDEEWSDFESRLRDNGYTFDFDANGRVDPKTINHPFDLQKNFKFKGRCIFVTDSADEAAQPIQSRSVIADISTTPQEFIAMSEKVIRDREKLGQQFSFLSSEATADDYRAAVNILKNNVGKIHERAYDEEGVQTVMSLIMNNRELMKTEEGKKNLNKRVVRALIGENLKKSITDSELLGVEYPEIKSAFLSLLN